MNKKYLFLALPFFLLASCSPAPEETNYSSEASLSSQSQSSEPIESVSSERNSLVSEESSSEQASQTKEHLPYSVWISDEEAMDVFKQTYENPQNEIQKDLDLKNDDLHDWELLLFGNNKAVFRQVNPDNPEEHDIIEMLRVDGHTEINVYRGERDAEGDTIDPVTPVKSYIVRESDFTVVDSKE